MDIYDHQTTRKSLSRHSKGKRLTEEQVRVLEKSFGSSKKLDPEKKLQLAGELGVPPRQVAIWYQNRRARWRTQSLEIDYNSLQVKLDSALAEKRELQRDVERLTVELRKARETMALAGLSHLQPQEPPYKNNSNGSNVIISSCCSNNAASGSGVSCHEEGGGSSTSNNSFNDDQLRDDHRRVSYCWKDEDIKTRLHDLDDLYACVMFSSGPARSDYN